MEEYSSNCGFRSRDELDVKIHLYTNAQSS
jgi:hypothetical protein